VSASDYSLYVLCCADSSLYTGIAIDVDKRVREHKKGGRGAKYLRGRAPFHLVFQQVIGDRSVASQLEYRVKQLDKFQKEALINGELSLASLLKDRSNEAAQTSGGSCG
jgi:putative endonuclease